MIYMKKPNTKLITRTAIMLALTIVFQALGRYTNLGPNSNFVVGPLVNACLLIATAAAGLWGGEIVSIVSPFGAIITGAALPIPFLPFVALGNLLLVVTFYYAVKSSKLKPYFKNEGKYIGILAGAILKFLFLYASVATFLSFYNVPSKLYNVMYFTFSWPQLVTAIVGGAIALVVIKALERNKIVKTE
jgi:uncharacterized membrane protein YeaQ/YmgE (transglycosylase-associated protein family)